MGGKSLDPIDVLVGNNLRTLRLRKGMSQGELGKLLGLTFQQIQKYEKGRNRIGAGRLFRAAALLEVPVSAFFDGVPQSGLAEHFETPQASVAGRDTIRMMDAFARIGGADSRLLLLRLAEKLAAGR